MIFEDLTKRRWKWAFRIFIAIVVIAAVLIANFVISLVMNPPVYSISKIYEPKGKSLKPDEVYATATANAPNIPKITPLPSNPNFNKNDYKSPLVNPLKNAQIKNKFVRTAFFVQGDPASVRSLETHIDQLDLVFPDWFNFTKGTSAIDEFILKDTLDLFESRNTLYFPVFSNKDRKGNWFGPEFAKFIKAYPQRRALINSMLNTIKKYKLKGINIDVESIDISSREDYLTFLDELAFELHKAKVYLTVDVPMNNDAFDYEVISKIADLVIIMAYDEHYPEGKPGPIASRDWFEGGIDEILSRVSKDKAIIATGQYAYDWNTSKPKEPANSLSFDQTMLLAQEVGADVQTDIQSVNYNFSYQDNNGDDHQVWMLDAVTLWDEIWATYQAKAAGIAMWRLGLEDPSVWDFYSKNDLNTFDPTELTVANQLVSVNYGGSGEILSITDKPTQGTREITFDGRIIDYSIYQTLPLNYYVQKFGHLSNKEVVFTFDDGPDPIYTPQLLDILKENNVKATFFVVGDQVSKYPDIVKREVDEGNLVGNHSYSHTNLAVASVDDVKSEINSVQRLIESITGKVTELVRPPYNANTSPTAEGDLILLSDLKNLGYVVVGADIDPSDYTKPGADVIVSSVMTQLKQSKANVIVFHDAGGDRSQTIEAVRKLIPLLRQNGYKIVNVNDLLGVSVASMMPNIDFKEQVIVFANSVWVWLRVWGWNIIALLFLFTTIISVFRILFLGFFVFKSKRKQDLYGQDVEDFEPFVSVLVPSYNEEKVIRRTIENLLLSTYKNFEIVVIDDGSTDKTAEIANEFAAKNNKIRVLKKENGGKFTALNLGFEDSKAEIIVTIDADTIVLPDTIHNLVIPFHDESVDAVCGNVQVGNVKNLITGFQAVEYVTTQNYDRRAFDALNCISVVPGATGAWKKSKVLEAMGYSGDTLTEDADLTLTMLEHGAKIVYMPSAKSVTETPDTVSTLFKQRFRWSFGTFQTLWKHRKSFFKGSLGSVAMPNMFVFQVLFPILSPIGDIVFILALIRGDMPAIIAGYILFLLMDLTGSLIAFTLEKTPLRYIWLILIQRFFYRQLMYVITFKALFAAIRGKRHGWNKLKRKGSVKI